MQFVAFHSATMGPVHLPVLLGWVGQLLSPPLFPSLGEVIVK